ncbi:hypothetical protein N325_09839, partial [Colius striatus]
NTLLQQLTGRLLKRGRLSSREEREGYRLEQFLHRQTPAMCEEWIPPSANKRLKSTASLNLKPSVWAVGSQLTCGHTGGRPRAEGRGDSEGEVCFQNESLNPGDATRAPTTPLAACGTKDLFLDDTVLEPCSSEGRNLLSSASDPGAVLQGAAGWSPELFFQTRPF